MCFLVCRYFCRAMRCISAAYAVMRCVSVCLSRSCIVSKRIKNIFETFSPPGSHTILDFPYQTGWRHSDGNPPNGGVESRWVGRNRDSEPICLLLTLQRARCCKHGRRWTTATISQVVAGRILRVFDHQAPRAIKSPSPWFFSARATKRALALYTITIDRMYDSKA